MARTRSWFFPLLGIGFAVAGADKLVGGQGYKQLFKRHWGWSEGDMRLVGAAELAGGLLVASRLAPRLGGAVLAGTSAAVLSAEVTHGDTPLAVPRLGLLLASLAAVVRG